MILRSIILAGLIGTCLVTSLSAEETIVPKAEISYEKQIRPILQAACFHCHGEEAEVDGGLDLRLRRFMVQGGDSGPAVIPGKPDESYLLDRISSGEMPPSGSGHPLSSEQQDLITRWIAQSAPTLRSEPDTLAPGMVILPEDQEWWAYQPVSRPELPEVRKSELAEQPIDRFVLHKLEESGFEFSPLADRKTLIRRACFDLWGLPPTPEMVEEFVNDEQPDAWERLLDRLLADDHFGERWARHWLDVAGYADSEGVTTNDPERKWAWQYRDYVIKSLNKNKPYNLFVQEQLAGDEMVTPPYKNMPPDAIEKLIATGFLRMAPDGTMSKQLDDDLTKNEVVADTVEIVSSIFLGLTVECAQCHEHRYDPIPQADYYRLRAVFEPALNWKKWKTPNQRSISLYTDEDRAQAAEIEAEAKKILDERLVKQQEFIDRNYDKELEKLTEAEREIAVAAREIAEKDRTPVQKAVYKKYPSLSITAGSLYLYDKPAADELKKMADAAAELRKTKPEELFVRALTETANDLTPTFVFNRGDHQQPKQEVKPAGLSILNHVVESQIPENDPAIPSTGRRLAFAKQLTSGQHPLTSRVIVNRIWLHLLGRGIVITPSDFGRLGTPPSHPLLLDWLADEFVQQNWDIKQFIKMVMLSRTYQQALSTDSAYLTSDPDIALFGSARLKRVEAEVLRDMVLEISGNLNEKMYGPPVPVMSDPVGQWVIGIENLSAGRPGKVLEMHGEDLRRSVYVQVRRTRPLSIFEVFDNPRMEPNCELRSFSTVAPQSLMLMNGDFIMQQAQDFATLLKTEYEDDTAQKINHLWQRVYARNPDQSELADAQQFLIEQQETLTERAGKEDDPALLAMANLCQILLSSNEFLYID